MIDGSRYIAESATVLKTGTCVHLDSSELEILYSICSMYTEGLQHDLYLQQWSKRALHSRTAVGPPGATKYHYCIVYH